MTQLDQVRRMLEAGWTCGTTFLDERIPRYGARFDDLRKQGVGIDKRRCVSHEHRSVQYEYRIPPFDAADYVIPPVDLSTSTVLGISVGGKYYTVPTDTPEWPSGENLVLTFQDGFASIQSTDSP